MRSEVAQQSRWMVHASPHPAHLSPTAPRHSSYFSPFTPQVRTVCALLLNVSKSDLPSPQEDLPLFLDKVKGLVAQENVVWNPATKRLQPWIDTQVPTHNTLIVQAGLFTSSRSSLQFILSRIISIYSWYISSLHYPSHTPSTPIFSPLSTPFHPFPPHPTPPLPATQGTPRRLLRAAAGLVRQGQPWRVRLVVAAWSTERCCRSQHKGKTHVATTFTCNQL